LALPETMAAYTDCYEIYDRAQHDGKGVRVHVGEQKDAGILRMRMNQARVLQRREAMRMYDRTDARYGKSENDKFRNTIKEDTEGNWWLYVEPWGLSGLQIESLSELADET